MVTRFTFWLGPLYQFRNHHGQLVVYLRLNGIVPPTTARRPGLTRTRPYHTVVVCQHERSRRLSGRRPERCVLHRPLLQQVGIGLLGDARAPARWRPRRGR